MKRRTHKVCTTKTTRPCGMCCGQPIYAGQMAESWSEVGVKYITHYPICPMPAHLVDPYYVGA